MEIPEDVLRRSIANLSDSELRKRWASKEFTDAALPIAEAELAKRSIEAAPESLSSALAEDAAKAAAFDLRGAVSSSRHIIRAAATAGGLVGLGLLGAVAGFALGYAISGPLAAWLGRIAGTRGAVLGAAAVFGLVVFVLVSFTATVVGMVFRAAS